MPAIKANVMAWMNKTKPGPLACKLKIMNGVLKQAGTMEQGMWKGGYRRKLNTDAIAESNVGAILQKGVMENFLDALDRNARGTYRNILYDAGWLAFYNASPHPVAWTRVDRNGTPAPHLWIKSIPCWSCGVVLPITAIQVDHSRTKKLSKDVNPWEVVAKFFRHQGMTQGAPKGAKGLHTSGVPHNLHTTAAQRYTLNSLGTLVFQVIASAKYEDDMAKNCLDSFANLRPMCSQCNTGRPAGISKLP